MPTFIHAGQYSVKGCASQSFSRLASTISDSFGPRPGSDQGRTSTHRGYAGWKKIVLLNRTKPVALPGNPSLIKTLTCYVARCANFSRKDSTTCFGAFAGEPALNGGSGSYSIIS